MVLGKVLMQPVETVKSVDTPKGSGTGTSMGVTGGQLPQKRVLTRDAILGQGPKKLSSSKVLSVRLCTHSLFGGAMAVLTLHRLKQWSTEWRCKHYR